MLGLLIITFEIERKEQFFYELAQVFLRHFRATTFDGSLMMLSGLSMPDMWAKQSISSCVIILLRCYFACLTLLRFPYCIYAFIFERINGFL